MAPRRVLLAVAALLAQAGRAAPRPGTLGVAGAAPRPPFSGLWRGERTRKGHARSEQLLMWRSASLALDCVWGALGAHEASAVELTAETWEAATDGKTATAREALLARLALANSPRQPLEERPRSVRGACSARLSRR